VKAYFITEFSELIAETISSECVIDRFDLKSGLLRSTAFARQISLKLHVLRNKYYAYVYEQAKNNDTFGVTV